MRDTVTPAHERTRQQSKRVNIYMLCNAQAYFRKTVSKLNSIITFDQLSALLIVQLQLPSFSTEHIFFLQLRAKEIIVNRKIGVK